MKSLTGPWSPRPPGPCMFSRLVPALPALADHTSVTLSSQLHHHFLREASLTAVSPLESRLVPPSILLLTPFLPLRTSLCTTVSSLSLCLPLAYMLWDGRVCLA